MAWIHFLSGIPKRTVHAVMRYLYLTSMIARLKQRNKSSIYFWHVSAPRSRWSIKKSRDCFRFLPSFCKVPQGCRLCLTKHCHNVSTVHFLIACLIAGGTGRVVFGIFNTWMQEILESTVRIDILHDMDNSATNTNWKCSHFNSSWRANVWIFLLLGNRLKT